MATSYTKTNWQDAPSTATPITAAQLNRMEKGIEDCSGQGNANELAIAANAEAIQTLESGIQLGSISITQLLLMAHPIGSIYSSTVATSPADLFGGTWERIKGRFIWGIDDSENAGDTGGEAKHTLTVDEMPSHEGHLYQNVTDIETGPPPIGSLAGFLEKSIMTAHPSSGRGWNLVAGNEVVPAGVSRGGDQPHNNMPPYYGAYVWRRTA